MDVAPTAPSCLVQVVVCSDQALVVETICAALTARGLAPIGLVGIDDSASAAFDASHCVAALMMADLEPDTARVASDLVRRVRVPWVVLTGLSGLALGWLVEAGAVVLPTSTTLDEVVSRLVQMYGGPVAPVAQRGSP